MIETEAEVEIDRRPGWQARAARRRKSEERIAAELEAREWLCVAPDHPMIEAVRLVLAGPPTQ